MSTTTTSGSSSSAAIEYAFLKYCDATVVETILFKLVCCDYLFLSKLLYCD